MKQIRNFFSKFMRKKMRFRGECWGFVREDPNPRKQGRIEEKRQN